MKMIRHSWPSLPTTQRPSDLKEPWKGRDADVGIHIGHKEVCQVAAVVAVDGHMKIFSSQNPDLTMRLAGLQLVGEFATFLLTSAPWP
jgi:hypothetical protein